MNESNLRYKVLEDLFKLMKENPTLEVIPMVDHEIILEDWGYWLGRFESVEKTEYFQDCERYFLDEEEIKEHLREDVYVDEEEVKNMTDDAYDSYINTKYNELVKLGEIKEIIALKIGTP